MTGWLLILAGTVCAMLALYAELNHKSIWARSMRTYSNSDSTLIQTLIRPNKISYYANLLIVLPVVFALAIWCVVIGVLLVS